VRKATIIRTAREAPPVDACFRFDEGQQRFAGIVDEVCRLGASEVRITVSITGADYDRLRCARGYGLGRAA